MTRQFTTKEMKRTVLGAEATLLLWHSNRAGGSTNHSLVLLEETVHIQAA